MCEAWSKLSPLVSSQYAYRQGQLALEVALCDVLVWSHPLAFLPLAMHHLSSSLGHTLTLQDGVVRMYVPKAKALLLLCTGVFHGEISCQRIHVCRGGVNGSRHPAPSKPSFGVMINRRQQVTVG
ncbi:hypothetical protein VNO77_08181 [Canavalia gladiata]|uniref:Uncharacterized protein n=1 Tax=Canavalia gladiata TaxID=3824 RepID=A0AAN9M9U1_CANGL